MAKVTVTVQHKPIISGFGFQVHCHHSVRATPKKGSPQMWKKELIERLTG
jgi:hypothetical protein